MSVFRLRANGRNNSQHCCVYVGSGVQTDATTPNNVGAALHGGKDTTHKSSLTMCNERARPQKCWKSCANGSNIVALRFGDHGTKEMLGVVG